MEQGNCLDSTLMSVRQTAAGRSDAEPKLDAAISDLLTRPTDTADAVQASRTMSEIGDPIAAAKDSPVQDLASACIEQVARLDHWDANPASFTTEQGEAEMDRWNAVFRRAIDTPSAKLRDLAGKAHLMLADLERFHPLTHDSTDDARLVRVILVEAMRFGGLFEVSGVEGRSSLPVTEPDPILAVVVSPANVDPDAELLALGRKFDAIHAKWVPVALAQDRTEEKAHALFKDLEARRGWTLREAHEASWAEPGLLAAAEGSDALVCRMEKIQAEIRALPARTLNGLAVKARAAIPGVWTRGQYQEDAGLGDGEDWTELNARSLIDECLHLAGVDWTGRRLRPSLPMAAEEFGTPGTAHPALTPKASAEGVNLADLGITELCALYDKAGATYEMWAGAMCQPFAIAEEHLNGSVTLSPLGLLADFEGSRLSFLRDRVVDEAGRRSPANKWDRDNLLSLRIQQEIACEGGIRDTALLADIARMWG